MMEQVFLLRFLSEFYRFFSVCRQINTDKVLLNCNDVYDVSSRDGGTYTETRGLGVTVGKGNIKSIPDVLID